MREIRPYGSVRGVRRKPYPYRDYVHPVRSTVVVSGTIFRLHQLLVPATESTEVLPLAARLAGFLGDCSGESLGDGLRVLRVGVTVCASEDFRNSWKSRSFEKM